MPSRSKSKDDAQKRSGESAMKKSKEGSKEGITTRKQQETKQPEPDDDTFVQLPFWCGHLPDRDVKELLEGRNEFLLRYSMDEEDVLCLTVAQHKNKV